MPIVAFTEIPSSARGAERDQFETFAQEFLEAVGFSRLQGASRGVDGGKDLLMVESLHGAVSTQTVTWLVSCKHLAHQGRAVGVKDEDNILERVGQHNADGFMGFYSTVPSTQLDERLRQLRSKIRTDLWHPELIERQLLSDSPRMRMLFQRFFAKSYAAWAHHQRDRVELYSEYLALPCSSCGSDLLAPPSGQRQGVIVFLRERDEQGTTHIHAVYCACKGRCDRELRERVRAATRVVDSWEDLADWLIPTWYLRQWFAIVNRIHSGKDRYAEEAFDALRKIVLALSQFVLRQPTAAERERFLELGELRSMGL